MFNLKIKVVMIFLNIFVSKEILSTKNLENITSPLFPRTLRRNLTFPSAEIDVNHELISCKEEIDLVFGKDESSERHADIALTDLTDDHKQFKDRPYANKYYESLYRHLHLDELQQIPEFCKERFTDPDKCISLIREVFIGNEKRNHLYIAYFEFTREKAERKNEAVHQYYSLIKEKAYFEIVEDVGMEVAFREPEDLCDYIINGPRPSQNLD